jgi:hypothetical protein
MNKLILFLFSVILIANGARALAPEDAALFIGGILDGIAVCFTVNWFFHS